MGVAYLVAHIYNFFVLTLRDYLTPGFDAGGQSHSHKTVYATLLIVLCLVSTVSMTVSGSCIPREAGFAKSPTQENNLRKRRLGTIMLFCKADISYDHTSYILNVNLGSMEQF